MARYESGPFFMMYNSWIELSRAAFAHNVSLVSTITNNIPIAFVIKSNGYGHGMLSMLNLAQAHPEITMVCVAGIQEALMARSYGWKKDILVMAYYDAELWLAARKNIIITIGSWQQLKQVIVHSADEPIRVHLKIETGMSRLGILLDDLPKILEQIKSYPHILVEGVFSHYCDTNNSDPSFSDHQQQRFNVAQAMMGAAGYHGFISHMGASGSLERCEGEDLVRVGTTLYGTWKSTAQQQRYAQKVAHPVLVPVLSWYAPIIYLHKQADIVIATISVGSADGFPASAAGKLKVKVAGMLCPVLKVTLHETYIDVTGTNVCLHDRVTLIGDDVSVYEYAQVTGMLVNELVTGISSAIARVIV